MTANDSIDDDTGNPMAGHSLAPVILPIFGVDATRSMDSARQYVKVQMLPSQHGCLPH